MMRNVDRQSLLCAEDPVSALGTVLALAGGCHSSSLDLVSGSLIAHLDDGLRPCVVR